MQQPTGMLDATATEKILSVMKERFRVNQLMEGLDEDDQQVLPKIDETNTNATTIKLPSEPEVVQNNAAARWGKLRKVVRGMSANSSKFATSDISMKSPAETPRDKVEDVDDELEMEDIELSEFWNSERSIKHFVVDQTLAPDVTLPPITENVDKVFVEDMVPMKVDINRIPEPVIAEKQVEIQQNVFDTYKKSINEVKKLQTDVIWREDLARKRVLEMEKQAKEKVTNEKLKLIQLKVKQENEMKKQFRKAREELEVGIKRQEGAIREHFGKLLVHEESLARRFHVFTRLFPQPIEIRIHLLRAVKDKLPKGSYVMMLTLYDSLGGNPLIWSNVGANGIGKIRPGITKIVKHSGRYFDRVMRFEDSCFALCPPRPMIKPSYVFVFELFQLASHFNPMDKIVAWSAVPMSFESMSIIEGKIKLPLLRGEHTPGIQHFLAMERLMASDLNNWLCNMYIEVRHMSLHELGATEDMLKSSNFDLDYLNKQIITESIRLKAEEKQLSHEEAILQAMKATPLAPSEVLLDNHETTGGRMNDPVYSQLLQKQYSQRLASMQQSQQSQSGKLKKANSTIAAVTGDVENQLAPIATANANATTGEEEKKSEEEHKNDHPDNMSTVLLPVDKGIFRRKIVTIANPSTSMIVPPAIALPQQENDMKIHTSYRANAPATWWSFPWYYWHRMRNRVLPTTATASNGGTIASPRIENFSEYRLQLIHEWKEKLYSEQQQQQLQGSPQPSPPKGMLSRNKAPSKVFTFKEETIQQNQSQSQSIPPMLKQPTANAIADEKEHELVEIRERGYNVQDEVFLHKEQRGKLFGTETLMDRESQQWASAGLEGKIVRRWQSEGSRFDSDAISSNQLPSAGQIPSIQSPVSPNHSSSNPIEETKWEELRDNREMLEYTMTIASDPTRKKHLIPGSIARSKLRYLSHELFGDIVLSSFGTMDFTLSVILYAIAAWIRIYIHYLAQYLYLLGQNTPVYAFELHVLFISFKYSSETLSTATEVGIVAIGPIATTLVFMLMMLCGMVLYQGVHSFPTFLSKFFAYYGVLNIFNPLLIFLIDLFYHHYTCNVISTACANNYNSSDCACYYGDFIKLWYRMVNLEGSGFTGAFLTAIIYLGIGVLSCLLLHEYLLYIHRSGRILDLWRRINANSTEEFFLPDDFEISCEELQFILKKNMLFNAQSKHLNVTRRVVVQEGYEDLSNVPLSNSNLLEEDDKKNNHNASSSWYDALVAFTNPNPPQPSNNTLLPTGTIARKPGTNDKKKKQVTYCKRYLIYQYNKQTKQEYLFRHFLLNATGQIFEIFHDLHQQTQQPAASSNIVASLPLVDNKLMINTSSEEPNNGGKMHLFDQVMQGNTNNNNYSTQSTPVSPRQIAMQAMQSTSKLYTLPRMVENDDEIVQNDGLDDLEGVEDAQFPDRYISDDAVTSPMHSPQKNNATTTGGSGSHDRNEIEEDEDDHLSLKDEENFLM